MTGTASAALRNGEAQVAVLRVWYPAGQSNTLSNNAVLVGTLGSVGHRVLVCAQLHTHADDK
jgi:hypothetical protein